MPEKLVVEFRFFMDDKVITPFGDEGIVQMLGYDDAKEQYFIKTANSNQWYKEHQLKAKD